ncbi:Radical SAM superfamily protein [uncultured archaeon]|nr:Radical SAM superfamily protein [uncultured archaeon]
MFLTAASSNLSRLDRPYKLNFAVTYACQSRCRTCNIWRTKPHGELTGGEIEEFARKNGYFRWLALTGGEPFVRSDVVGVVKSFSENSKGLYMFTCPTNSLCNLETEVARVREILELGLPRAAITVSLDGHRELHDKTRGIPGNYDKALRMFKALKALSGEHKNLHVEFGYTLSAFNLGQFARTFDAVRAEIPGIRHNDFHINLAQTSENYYNNEELELSPERSAAAEELRYILGNREAELDPIQIIEGAFIRRLLRFVETGSAGIRSRSLDASLFMDAQGNVFPSIMWNRKIGNVRECGYDLRKIWHGAEAEKVRSDLAKGKEPNCWTSCEAYQALIGNVPSLLR